MAFVYILVHTVSVMLAALELLMLARAIMSWLPVDEESAMFRFLIVVTEPIILPVRKLLERSETIASLPIDLSFMVAYLLLIIVQFLLPTVIM